MAKKSDTKLKVVDTDRPAFDHAVATVHFTGLSPYSSSAPIRTPRGGLTPDAHEEKFWRERINVNADGFAVFPAMAFKNGLTAAAKGKQMKLVGRKTYIDAITAGIFNMEDVLIEPKIAFADVPFERRFVPPDGKRGGSSRVWKNFPILHAWGGSVQIFVLDLRINERVLTEHLEFFGKFVGLGRFRPESNGYYGRFRIDNIEWQEVPLAEAA